MQCYECGDVVEWCGDEGVKWFLEDLRWEMDGWEAWEVDERCVERWDAGFEKMVPLLRGRQVEGCWLLEQEEVTEQGDEGDVGEAQDEGVQGGESAPVRLDGEEKVEERRIEGLEALRLMGGEGFTADGFIHHKSPLWGSVVDEQFEDESMGEDSLIADSVDQISFYGEFEDGPGSQVLLDKDDDVDTSERIEAIQTPSSPESFEVKEPAIIRIGGHDLFIVDMLDASMDKSSESDIPDDMDPDGAGIDTGDEKEDFESSVASDESEDVGQNSDEDEEMDIARSSDPEAASDDDDDTDSLFGERTNSIPIDEMDFDDSPGLELFAKESESETPDHEDEQEIFTESEDQISEEEESDIASSESNFEDHQRYPLGNTMAIDVRRELEDFETVHSEAGQMERGLDEFGDLVQGGETQQYTEGGYYDEEGSEVESNSGGELDMESIGGEADDEESDEVLDVSDSDEDVQTSENTELDDLSAEDKNIRGEHHDSEIDEGIRIGDSGSVSTLVDSYSEAEDEDEVQYEHEVEQAALIGYGAQFQGVRDYQSDESEESEEE